MNTAIKNHAAITTAWFLSYLFVHSSGIVLANVIRHLDDLYCHDARAHGNFDPVANLDFVAGLDNSAIYADTAIVTGFIGNRPTLDQTGYLQILVKTHS